MKRAIFPLLTFLMIVAGMAYYYPKLNHIRPSDHTFLHDRPVACKTCGALMWEGPQAHLCTEQVDETL